jgi:hypothetical protein
VNTSEGKLPTMHLRSRIYPGIPFRYCLATFLLIGLLPQPVRVQAPTLTVTTVEHSQPWPRPKPGTLGTMRYPPTTTEKPFIDKLSPKERVAGSMFEEYSIERKTGTYISWCGIVRKIDEDSAAGRTKLLVEMKYFDGKTDTHIMALSFNGAGDFLVELNGTGTGIKRLSLVRVYGQVVREAEGIPEVHADYVRDWDWGLFTFLAAYGEQKGNLEWRKLNRVDLDHIYNPFPATKYYVDRLGPRE